MQKGKLLRMDNVALVVEDIKAAIAFFTELGMELEGETTVEGPLVDSVVGLRGVRTDIAMMRMPDGHGKIELTRYHKPAMIPITENIPVNMQGFYRVMFAVEDIEEVVRRLEAHGATLIGELTNYKDIYKLCYIRGPEGIVVALAERIGEGDPMQG